MQFVEPLRPRRAPNVLPRLIYLWRFGRWPDLAAPRRFSELVYARKLFERDPRWPALADKVAVKAHVAATLGDDWVIPTLWHGTTLPETPPWPRPFVLKSSHASQQSVFVRAGEALDWPAVRRRAARWLRRPYAPLLHEWLYSEIEPQLLVEPLIGCGRVLPFDYKFFVFGGRVEFIQVDLDREHRHRRVMFDRAWRRLDLAFEFPADARPMTPPRSLERMIAAAETLGAPHDFARVDLYDVDGRPYFGEITLYPGSGLDRFRPGSWDLHFGSYWAEQRPAPPQAARRYGSATTGAMTGCAATGATIRARSARRWLTMR
ncbi:ATP-grasp fold amidoligase family protein [Sphingomonas sp. DT-51]